MPFRYIGSAQIDSAIDFRAYLMLGLTRVLKLISVAIASTMALQFGNIQPH